MRALYAVPYPAGPVDPTTTFRLGGSGQEGCIVVASSDESVKFHEIWAEDGRTMVGGAGALCGSDILEGLQGIDKDGDIIR